MVRNRVVALVVVVALGFGGVAMAGVSVSKGVSVGKGFTINKGFTVNK